MPMCPLREGGLRLPGTPAHERSFRRQTHTRPAEPAVIMRVLGEILLMIGLGVVEGGRIQDLGRDGRHAFVGQRRLVTCQTGLRRRALVFREDLET